MSRPACIALVCGFAACFAPLVSASVSINEIAPHASSEWVELYNASESADYLKAYYIDDDSSFTDDTGSSAKKTLTGLITGSARFPYIVLSGSIFNNSGDRVVLFDDNGTIVDQFEYGTDPGENVSIGRFPDETGAFAVLSSPTQGSENAAAPTPTATPQSTATYTPTGTKNPTPTKSPVPTKNPTPSVKPATATVSPSANPIAKKEFPVEFSPTAVLQPEGTATAERPYMPFVLGVSAVSSSAVPQAGINIARRVAVALMFVASGLMLLAGVFAWKQLERRRKATLP